MAAAFTTCISVILFFTGTEALTTFLSPAAFYTSIITLTAGAIAAIIPYSSKSGAKCALWTLGALLAFDMLFVSYFHVFRASYYFPGRYEDAFLADFWALVFGIPILCVFITLLIKILLLIN